MVLGDEAIKAILTYHDAKHYRGPPYPQVCFGHPGEQFLVKRQQRELDKPEACPVLYTTLPHDLGCEPEIRHHGRPWRYPSCFHRLEFEEDRRNDYIENTESKVGQESDKKQDVLRSDGSSSPDLDSDTYCKHGRGDGNHRIVDPEEIMLRDPVSTRRHDRYKRSEIGRALRINEYGKITAALATFF